MWHWLWQHSWFLIWVLYCMVAFHAKTVHIYYSNATVGKQYEFKFDAWNVLIHPNVKIQIIESWHFDNIVMSKLYRIVNTLVGYSNIEPNMKFMWPHNWVEPTLYFIQIIKIFKCMSMSFLKNINFYVFLLIFLSNFL